MLKKKFKNLFKFEIQLNQRAKFKLQPNKTLTIKKNQSTNPLNSPENRALIKQIKSAPILHSN